jgi:hypothetical protein
MISQKSSGLKGKEGGVARNLTSQHLAGRFDNTNDKRVALFMMYNLRHQTIYLIVKNRYLLHQTRSFASFIKSHLSLAFAKVKRASRSEILEEYSAY